MDLRSVGTWSGSIPAGLHYPRLVHLLYVAEDVPNRDPVLGDGSSMITYEVLLALPADLEVSLLAFDRGIAVPPEIRARCRDVLLLPLQEDSPGLAQRLALWRDPSTEARSHPEAVQAVRRLSGAADVTLMHGPHVLGLARHVEGPLVLQTVDPWSAALGLSRDLAAGPRRLYWGLRARFALAGERRLPRRARLLTVGEADARTWSRALGRPVHSIANGVHRVQRNRQPRPVPVACFIGSLDYQPNIESAQTLVREVAPLVWQERPEVQFLLAGRLPVPEVLALAQPRVEIRANVPSMADVLAEADLAVFPDSYGVGVRNSVQEALAAGLPVVCTPAAARELVHPSLHVEPTPEAVARKVLELLAPAAGARPGPALAEVAPLRSWADAAADYLDELRAAVGAGPGPAPEGSSPPR